MDKLEESLHDSPVIEKEGYQYFVHPITDGIPEIDPELLREIAVKIIQRAEVIDIDKILVPEAMGIHVGTALSIAVDRPLSVVRKKSYGFKDEVSVEQETGYSENELYINGVSSGDRVLIVDDVVSTGGTLKALCNALISMDAEIVDVVAVFRKGDGPNEELPVDVKYLQGVDVIDGEVVLLD